MGMNPGMMSMNMGNGMNPMMNQQQMMNFGSGVSNNQNNNAKAMNSLNMNVSSMSAWTTGNSNKKTF